MSSTAGPRWEAIDFAGIEGAACPCGTSRRALGEAGDVPFSLHRVEICDEARLHYHKRLTETYYFLECEPGAQMELDGQLLQVKAGMCVVIRPGTRHRAVGRMTVLNIVCPKFDPADEWFD